jgi:hypothetical protein
MLADIAIKRYSGASGSASVRLDTLGGLGALVFSTSDELSPLNNYPLDIPQDGTKVSSYWVTIGLEAIEDPVGTVGNILFYTDGINSWPGTELLVATASSYSQATGTLGVKGTTIYSHPNLSSAVMDAFSYTEGNPLSISGSTTGIGPFGDLLIMQLVVGSTAEAGGLPIESFHLTWDEV